MGKKKFNSLFHLALHVTDMKKTVDFYKKVGCDEMFTLKLPDGRDWLTYMRVAPGQYLELFNTYEDHPMTPHGKVEQSDSNFFGHFSFLVPSLKYTAQQWKKEGIDLVYAPFKPEPIPVDDNFDPHVGADGNAIGWIVDPDGTWIEVMEELDESWQKKFEETHPF